MKASPTQRVPSPLKARLEGLAIAAGALLWFAINAWRIWYDGKFYPAAVPAGTTFLGIGLWRLVFGQPVDARTGKPAQWSITGMFVAGGAGLFFGLAVLFILRHA